MVLQGEGVDGMEYFGVLSGIAGVFLLACLSPGPVWVVITSTSIAVSRKAGVLTGLGVAGATLTWATLSMLGLGLLAQLTWLTIVIKLAGAAYLAWIGCRMIGGARRPAPVAGSPPRGTTEAGLLCGADIFPASPTQRRQHSLAASSSSCCPPTRPAGSM